MKPIIPADVRLEKEDIYRDNYKAITRGCNKLFLFACDQKIEHLNRDFIGNSASSVDHLFTIAQQGSIGAMAAHYGLIARHAPDYPSIDYIVKLNGKTPLLPQNSYEPYSVPLWTVDDALTLRENGIMVRGIGLTIYFGSEHEASMMEYAARMIADAHHEGLLAVVWAYPRGKNITNPYDEELLAGIAGVAHTLGADFIKLEPSPKAADLTSSIATAASNSGVIYAGGSCVGIEQLLARVYHQQAHGARGCAIGRNIFQRPLPEAISLTKALSALIYEHTNAQDAMILYESLLRLFC
jgi:class I fructose-bisphosphate aldolase